MPDSRFFYALAREIVQGVMYSPPFSPSANNGGVVLGLPVYVANNGGVVLGLPVCGGDSY